MFSYIDIWEFTEERDEPYYFSMSAFISIFIISNIIIVGVLDS